MKISARLQRLEVQMNEQREIELKGTILYDVQAGEFFGSYRWKPGEPHTRKIEVIDGIPRPAGFKGTMIIDDILDDEEKCAV